MVTIPTVQALAPQSVERLGDAVHLWMADLDVAAPHRDRLASLLSADELARARRLVFEQHRHRFIAARGLLRTILAHYLDIGPAAIRFRYEPGGRPALDAAGLQSHAAHRPRATVRATQELTFNLSHADRLVLIAVGCGARLGVDVERVRDDLETSDLERHCLAPTEIAALASLEAAARRRAFFLCWARKESYLKAIGTGLTVSLPAIAVEPRPDMPGVSRVVADDVGADWHVHDLVIPTGYAAAIALDAPRPIVSRTWTGWMPGDASARNGLTVTGDRVDGGLRHERAR